MDHSATLDYQACFWKHGFELCQACKTSRPGLLPSAAKSKNKWLQSRVASIVSLGHDGTADPPGGEGDGRLLLTLSRISWQEGFILTVLETENKMWANKQKNMKHFKNYILGFLKIPWEKKPWNKTRTTVSCKLIFRQEYSLGLAGILLQAGMRMCYIFGDKILQWLVAGRRHGLRDTQQASKEGRGRLLYVLPTVALRWLGGL